MGGALLSQSSTNCPQSFQTSPFHSKVFHYCRQQVYSCSNNCTVIILFYSFQLNQLQQSEVDYRSIHKKESFSCFYSVVPFIQTNSTKQSNSIHPSIKCLWLNGMNWLLFCELFDLRHSASWIHQIYFINSLHSFHYIHKLRRQCPSILFFSSFSSLGRAEMKRKKGIEWAAAVILAPAPRGSPNATSIDFTNSIH